MVAMDAKPLKTSAALGIAFAYIRIAVLIVISFVYPAFVIWKVGKTEYGILEYVLSLTESLALLSIGAERAYAHFATRARDEKGEEGLAKLNTVFLIMFACIALLQIAGTFLIASLAYGGVIGGGSYEGNSRVFQMIAISGLTVAFEFFFSLFSCYVLFNQNFTFEYCALMISKILTTALSIVFLSVGFDTRSVLIVTAIVTFVYVVVGVLHAAVELKMRFKWPGFQELRREMRGIFRFSFFIFIFVLTKEIALVGGKLIMGSVGDDIDVTIISYAVTFLSFAFMMALAVSETYRPDINEFAERGDVGNIHVLFLRGIIVSFSIIAGFFALLLLCGREFIAIWLYDSDLSGEEITKIYNIAVFMLGIWVLPLSFFVGLEIQRAFEKHKLFAFFILIAALSGLVVSILMSMSAKSDDDGLVYAPMWGMIVAPAALLSLSLFYFFFVFKTPLHRALLRILMSAGAILAGFLPAYFIDAYALTSLSMGPRMFIKSGIFIAIYLPLLYLFFHHDLNLYFAKAHQNHVERHLANLKRKQEKNNHVVN